LALFRGRGDSSPPLVSHPTQVGAIGRLGLGLPSLARDRVKYYI